MAGELILIVEDEEKIAKLLKDYFENSGYETVLIDNGKDVVGFVKNKHVDLILLDIMLPGLDGISVCQKIRTFSNIPIIFLTAKVEEIDLLLGLEMGSDDYIRKPFRPREVVARVKAVLRRVASRPTEVGIEIGVMALKEDEHIIMVNGKELDLTPNEFGILKVFINNPKKVFSRSELVDRVQGYSYEGYERTIDTHIKNIRKKIAQFLPKKEIIKAVYGVGYKLNEKNLMPVNLS
ncbi:MAG: response regulator [Desulfobacteraceae bacterium]|nr:response regulator [Desulfobacteraceae bacterium]